MRALLCSRRHKGGLGMSFVVELHHELVKVAQVEDDRHAKSLVYFDALKKQPTDERPARLGRVVVGPVSGAWSTA
jgi:hypothetical protein